MDEIYHIYNRSISEIEIFTNNHEYTRFIDGIRFYQVEKPQIKYSDFIDYATHLRGGADVNYKSMFIEKEKAVDIIAYCIMPTHFHLLLMQLKEKGIATFTSNLLNSYTRYFNIKYQRKGTLWEGRTKKVIVENDEQLLHLTRYIHLNPVTAYIVNRAEMWSWSSYCEYISDVSSNKIICNYSHFLKINPVEYKKFVESGVVYQREMAKARKDNHSSTCEVNI